MRRLVAVLLGGVLFAAPAVTLACRWSCAEPAAVTAREACHEAPVSAVALTGANACAEHPATEDQAVPLARVALTLPTLDTPVVLVERNAGLLAPIPAIGHTFSPLRPPLPLRI